MVLPKPDLSMRVAVNEQRVCRKNQRIEPMSYPLKLLTVSCYLVSGDHEQRECRTGSIGWQLLMSSGITTYRGRVIETRILELIRVSVS